VFSHDLRARVEKRHGVGRHVEASTLGNRLA
jgi:hypothetical protein